MPAITTVPVVLDVTLDTYSYCRHYGTATADSASDDIVGLIEECDTLAAMAEGPDGPIVDPRACRWTEGLMARPQWKTLRLWLAVTLDDEKWTAHWGVAAAQSLSHRLAADIAMSDVLRRYLRATVAVAPNQPGPDSADPAQAGATGPIAVWWSDPAHTK